MVRLRTRRGRNHLPGWYRLLAIFPSVFVIFPSLFVILLFTFDGAEADRVSVYVPVGSSKNLSCEYSKYGDLESRIYWLKNGRQVVTVQDGSIAFMMPRTKIDHHDQEMPDGVPNRRSVLEIKQIRAEDFATYACRVETVVPGVKRDGERSTVSTTFQLQASIKPLVSLERLDGTQWSNPLRVIEDKEILLRCRMIGSADTKLIWIFNGALLQNSFDGVETSRVLDGYVSFLRRKFTRAESRLDVTCAAQNAFTKQTTNVKDAVTKSVQILVEYAPEKPVLVYDESQWIKEGSFLPLTCMLHKNGEPPATLHLYMSEGRRNIQPLLPNNGGGGRGGGGGGRGDGGRASSTIPGRPATVSTQLKILRRHHNSTLVCEARSPRPELTSSSNISLKVAYGPDSVAITGIRSGSLAINDEINAVCDFGNAVQPPPTVVWILQRVANLEEAARNVTIGDSASLNRFRPTWRDHGAKLTCLVTNDCGTSATDLWNRKSSSIIISVPHKPVWTGLTSDSRKIRAREGSFVEITCRVSGYPAPKITWYFQGEKLENNDPFSPLTLKRTVSLDTFGDYACVARNGFGQARFAIELVDSERILKYVTLVGGLVGIVIVTAVCICCVRKRRQVMRKRKRRLHEETMKAMDLRPNNKRGLDGGGSISSSGGGGAGGGGGYRHNAVADISRQETPEYFQRGLYSNVRLSNEMPKELSYFERLDYIPDLTVTTTKSTSTPLPTTAATMTTTTSPNTPTNNPETEIKKQTVDPRKTDSDEGISRDNSLSDVSYQDGPTNHAMANVDNVDDGRGSFSPQSRSPRSFSPDNPLLNLQQQRPQQPSPHRAFYHHLQPYARGGVPVLPGAQDFPPKRFIPDPKSRFVPVGREATVTPEGRRSQMDGRNSQIDGRNSQMDGRNSQLSERHTRVDGRPSETDQRRLSEADQRRRFSPNPLSSAASSQRSSLAENQHGTPFHVEAMTHEPPPPSPPPPPPPKLYLSQDRDSISRSETEVKVPIVPRQNSEKPVISRQNSSSTFIKYRRSPARLDSRSPTSANPSPAPGSEVGAKTLNEEYGEDGVAMGAPLSAQSDEPHKKSLLSLTAFKVTAV